MSSLSLCDLASPIKLGSSLICSGQPLPHSLLSKFSAQKTNFVGLPLLSSLRPRNSTRDARVPVTPSATDNDKAAAEPSFSDSATAEPANTSNQPDVNGKEKSTAQAPKRSPLTAREKLRAARVLSKYTESKPQNARMGSRVLEALKESDDGKRRSGLPQAPTNLFDDSKRGMPKQGLTFDFPGGADLFFIALSFVLISTIMFTTTYIVWKVGAIHFNEY